MSEKKTTKKKPYQKPEITTDNMDLFGHAGGGGSTCNGTSTGGRKSTTAAPETCSGAKLKT